MRKTNKPDAPVDIITNPWKRLVFDKEGRITKRGYTLCFLEKLQDALRRRDVYVENSERWGDSRVQLLSDADWQAHRIQIYHSLGHPINPQEAIAVLTSNLDDSYRKVANNFPQNDAVKLDLSGRNTSLTITNLDKLEESTQLVQLTKQVNNLLCQ